MATASYNDYKQVPIFRRQWFFWLSWIFVTPLIGVGLLVTGDVYYKKLGEVRAFGVANRIVAGLLGLLWLGLLIRALTAAT